MSQCVENDERWEWGVNPKAAMGAANEIVVRPVGEFPHGAWIADCGRIGEAEERAALIAQAPELAHRLSMASAALRCAQTATEDAVRDCFIQVALDYAENNIEALAEGKTYQDASKGADNG